MKNVLECPESIVDNDVQVLSNVFKDLLGRSRTTNQAWRQQRTMIRKVKCQQNAYKE